MRPPRPRTRGVGPLSSRGSCHQQPERVGQRQGSIRQAPKHWRGKQPAWKRLPRCSGRRSPRDFGGKCDQTACRFEADWRQAQRRPCQIQRERIYETDVVRASGDFSTRPSRLGVGACCLETTGTVNRGKQGEIKRWREFASGLDRTGRLRCPSGPGKCQRHTELPAFRAAEALKDVVRRFSDPSVQI
jgi:hypothetical protein